MQKNSAYPLYQINAFTDRAFGGNPAAVCPLAEWLPDATMQSLAAENNLAETAFFVPLSEGLYHIRWFTPLAEVALCGHATLATAHTLWTLLGYESEKIQFQSQSGILEVRKDTSTGRYILNFPSDHIVEVPIIEHLVEGLGKAPKAFFKGKTDYFAIFETETDIINLRPDFRILGKIVARGVVTTAKGDNMDFVSRSFFPQTGVDEDPVTGSAHTLLIPYWAKKLGKNTLTAQQISYRKGDLWCEYLGERVEMAGYAKTYLIGEYQIS